MIFGFQAQCKIYFDPPSSVNRSYEFYQSHKVIVWSLLSAQDNKYFPSELKQRVFTDLVPLPYLKLALGGSSGELVSQTIIFGFFPTSPVATNYLSGCKAREVISSECPPFEVT